MQNTSIPSSVVACLVVWVICSTSLAEDVTVKAFESIQLGEIQEHTEVLADDALEGREAGRPGSYAAANYIVKQLNEAKLEPAGEHGGFFQAYGNGYRNILSSAPGSKTGDAQSWILISAHYDHVGRGTKNSSNGEIGLIHNGADDNASGVAAVLEVAEAISELAEPLKSSVLIVFWDAEEKGLLGSKYWLKHPTIDVEDVKLMVNVDMVGRLRDSLSLFGSRTMSGLRNDWCEANSESNLPLKFPWQITNNSDHYEFFKKRIPITMVHSGLHDDYHRPSDDVHLLNQDGIHKTAQLIFRMLVATANKEQHPPFRNESFLEGISEQRYFERSFRERQRRLGVTLKSVEGQEGLEVDTVWVGSPANQVGLKPGDLILKANGLELNRVSTLRGLIVRARKSILLDVQTAGGERKNLDILLEGKPQKIGISWRTNDAEPGVVVLSSVVPGSLAAQAGCKRLDRVVALNGEPVSDSDHFRDSLATAIGKVELRIERDGRFRTIVLDVQEGDLTDQAEAGSNSESSTR